MCKCMHHKIKFIYVSSITMPTRSHADEQDGIPYESEFSIPYDRTVATVMCITTTTTTNTTTITTTYSTATTTSSSSSSSSSWSG